MAESLQFGIVSSSDMYYFCDAMVRAVEESGRESDYFQKHHLFAEGSVKNSDSYREAEELIRSCHGAAGGRILIDASIHAEYTNTLQSMEEVADLAKKYNVNMHVHVSETKDEHENCKAKYRKHRPVCCAIWELLMCLLRQPTAYGQRNRYGDLPRKKALRWLPVRSAI